MRTVVGVLRGGPSSEYEVSLQTGGTVLRELDTGKYEPRDVFISRTGDWHLHGVPVTPERALRGVDVAFNTVHGEYGEDGRLHRILDTLSVPYTGAGVHATTLAFNKERTRDAVGEIGIKVPYGITVEPPEDKDIEALALRVFRSFPHPAVVKPVIGGSSVGITVVDNFNALAWGLKQAFAIAPKALIEEKISGREGTVGVLDHFRGERAYALLPVEVKPASGFYDYDAKYLSDATEYVVPGRFSPGEKDELMDIARRVHQHLGMEHYSRSDFIVSPRGIYFLEINSAPAVGLTSHSLLPMALHAVGSKLSEFLDHVISLAKKGKS